MLVKKEIVCGSDDADPLSIPDQIIEKIDDRSLQVKHRLTNNITIEGIKHYYSKEFASISIPGRLLVGAGKF
jgi:hypothetical protein